MAPRAIRKMTESDIQRAVFAHINARGVPGLYAFHVPNGGYRRPVEAAIMKGLGTRPGVPDIIAVHRGQVFALELKCEGGRTSPLQHQAITELEDAGAYTCVAEGLDRALQVLEGWGLLRGEAA